MLRRTPKCLSRRQALLLRPRCLSTTLPRRLATPTSGFAPTFDKIKESLKIPLDHLSSIARPSYTSTLPSSGEPSDLVRTCTVLTSDPKATPLQDLLDRVPRFDAGNESGLFTDFLLLVTPSYAASLQKQKVVIEKALARIFPVKELDKNLHNRLGGTSREAVRLVAAVVDRLPAPSDVSASAVGDTGSEGIAIRLVANQNPIWKPELNNHDPRVALSDNRLRFVSFQLDDAATPPHMLPIVQVPLANTIFQNGLSSTLIWRKYSLQPDGKGLEEIDEQLCNSHRVKLPHAPNQTNNLAMSVPLVPLTAAISVVACMGNIIRRLSADPGLGHQDPTKEAILASQELEQSVTSYHKTRGLSPRAVSVWALVIPEKTFSGGLSMAAKVLGERNLPELWKSGSNYDTDSSQPNLLTLLQHGARLHKVLSGGGGWGKKAGLLSLDPDTGYGQHPSWEEIAPAQQTEPEYIEGLAPVPADMQHVWGLEPQALPSIVNKGDYIQFYISPSASSEEAHTQAAASTDTTQQNSQLVKTVEFGSIPSTVDDMPVNHDSTAAGQSGITVYPNHFGALSETGIAMFFGLNSDKADSSNIHNATDAATKVDVPFGRMRCRSQIVKPRQAETGLGFSPTKPLQSKFFGRALYWQELAGTLDTYQKTQRRALSSGFHDNNEATPKGVSPSFNDHTVYQSATKSALTPRILKQIQRVPGLPNKNWTSKDINDARKATRNASQLRIIKIASHEGAKVRLIDEYADKVGNRKLEAFARQSIEDVVSPEAFQDFLRTQKVPGHPNEIWTALDIRKAHTLRKRKYKFFKEVDAIRDRELAREIPSNRRQPSPLPPKEPVVIRDYRHQQQPTCEQETPTIQELKLQAQSRARQRILKEAFRGILSPSSQRRAMNPKYSPSTSESSHITVPQLTRRIMHLLDMHEPGCPRIRVYELLDIDRIPENEEMAKAIEKEQRESRKEETRQRGLKRKEELREQLETWRNAAEELRDAVLMKYPAPGKKQKWKEVVDDELKEIGRVERSVNQFLVG